MLNINSQQRRLPKLKAPYPQLQFHEPVCKLLKKLVKMMNQTNVSSMQNLTRKIIFAN